MCDVLVLSPRRVEIPERLRGPLTCRCRKARKLHASWVQVRRKFRASRMACRAWWCDMRGPEVSAPPPCGTTHTADDAKFPRTAVGNCPQGPVSHGHTVSTRRTPRRGAGSIRGTGPAFLQGRGTDLGASRAMTSPPSCKISTHIRRFSQARRTPSSARAGANRHTRTRSDAEPVCLRTHYPHSISFFFS